MAPSYQSLAAFCWFPVPALGASMSYKVTLNSEACREVHLGALTRPSEITYHGDEAWMPGTAISKSVFWRNRTLSCGGVPIR